MVLPTCQQKVDYADEFAVTVNAILAGNKATMAQSIYLKDIPDMMAKFADAKTCTCSWDGPSSVCTDLEHLAVLTTCISSEDSASFPSSTAPACGAVFATGIVFDLPATKFIIDDPEPMSLVQTIAYNRDSLFYEDEVVQSQWNVSTPPFDITVAGARMSGLFTDGQELTLSIPVDPATNVSLVERSCAYYMSKGSAFSVGWHPAGMYLDTELTNEAVTVCKSNHLTTFVVLHVEDNGLDTSGGAGLDLQQSTASGDTEKDCRGAVRITLYLGVGVCIICLLIRIVRHDVLPGRQRDGAGIVGPTGTGHPPTELQASDRTPGTRIVLWLAWAMLFAVVLVLVAINRPSGSMCIVVAGCLHLAMLCSVGWMLNTGIHLHQSIASMRVKASGYVAKWWSLSMYIVVAIVTPVVIVGATMTGRKSQYDDNAASCWLTQETMWAFVIPAALALVAQLVVLVLTRENLSKFEQDFKHVIAEEKSIQKRATGALRSEEMSVMQTVDTAKMGIRYTCMLTIMMAGTWIAGVMLLLNPCSDVWQITFALVAAVFGVYVAFFHVSVDPVIEHDFAWLHNRERDAMVGFTGSPANNGGVRSEQAFRRADTHRSSGYLSVGGSNPTLVPPVHAWGANTPNGNLPSLIEVFRLFERICLQDNQTLHNALIMKSPSHDLCAELPQIFPHEVTDATGAVISATGKQMLGWIDSVGNHDIGIFVFLKTVEAMERHREPDEVDEFESASAVNLLHVFSALNDLDHEGLTDRELSSTFDVVAFGESLPRMFEAYDTPDNACGASRYIISRLPANSDSGLVTLREFLSTVHTAIRGGWWHTNNDRLGWHPARATQPCEFYFIVASYRAFAILQQQAPTASTGGLPRRRPSFQDYTQTSVEGLLRVHARKLVQHEGGFTTAATADADLTPNIGTNRPTAYDTGMGDALYEASTMPVWGASASGNDEYMTIKKAASVRKGLSPPGGDEYMTIKKAASVRKGLSSPGGDEYMTIKKADSVRKGLSSPGGDEYMTIKKTDSVRKGLSSRGGVHRFAGSTRVTRSIPQGPTGGPPSHRMAKGPAIDTLLEAQRYVEGPTPASWENKQATVLFNAFSALHLDSPDTVLSGRELRQGMDVAYLRQQLPGALDQINEDVDGQTEAAKMLRHLDQGDNRTVTVAEFLRVARMVRTKVGTNTPTPHYSPPPSSFAPSAARWLEVVSDDMV